MDDIPDSPFMVLWKKVEALEERMNALEIHAGMRMPHAEPEPERPYVSPLRAED